METLIIIAPRAYEAEFNSRLASASHVSKLKVGPSTPGTIIVTDGHGRVYIRRDDSIGNDFEPKEFQRIRETMAAPVFYSLDFSDIGLCRAVVAALFDDEELLIDNDHGVLLTGSDFVRVLRGQAEWDWRCDPVPGKEA
jgi:hypothetical protein